MSPQHSVGDLVLISRVYYPEGVSFTAVGKVVYGSWTGHEWPEYELEIELIEIIDGDHHQVGDTLYQMDEETFSLDREELLELRGDSR